MPFKYSKAVQKISDAKSITINQKVYELQRAGHNPIVFSSGEAFFDMDLYPFNKVGVKQGFHYSDTQGIPALREKIAKFYNSSYCSNITANEIIISPGSKFSIFAVFKTILDNTDEVLMHEPCWLYLPTIAVSQMHSAWQLKLNALVGRFRFCILMQWMWLMTISMRPWRN